MIQLDTVPCHLVPPFSEPPSPPPPTLSHYLTFSSCENVDGSGQQEDKCEHSVCVCVLQAVVVCEMWWLMHCGAMQEGEGSADADPHGVSTVSCLFLLLMQMLPLLLLSLHILTLHSPLFPYYFSCFVFCHRGTNAETVEGERGLGVFVCVCVCVRVCVCVCGGGGMCCSSPTSPHIVLCLSPQIADRTWLS